MTLCNFFACVLPLPRQEEAMNIAGIDVHKKVLMVVVIDASTPEGKLTRRRFATMPSELHRLLNWLREQGVEVAVMESTASAGGRCGWNWSLICVCTWRRRFPTVSARAQA